MCCNYVNLLLLFALHHLYNTVGEKFYGNGRKNN